jgi:uncharacterized membrane protein YgaE (UPF0421/DUF939 family)
MVMTMDRVQNTVTELGQRSAAGFSDRLRRVRGSLLFAVQAGIAAGIAWLIANDALGHQRPFFAPIAAVIALNVSVGQRLRRTIELVVGVALGILVGDSLIYVIGTGPWQISLSVAMAILAAVFGGGGPTVIGQAASSAVLVATLAPPSSGIYYNRFIDALIGGVVGLLVMALLLPVNPLTVMSKAARPAFEALAEGLRECADALAAWRLADAESALAALRGSEQFMSRFRDALADARETATLAPVRWRARGPLAQYLDAAPHLDHAVRNARVLARRTVAVIRDGEESSEELVTAIRGMADAVETLRRELTGGSDQLKTREQALTAVAHAGEAYRQGLGFSGDVVVAQVRAIGSDLLLATGCSETDQGKAIRKAVGKVRKPSP